MGMIYEVHILTFPMINPTSLCVRSTNEFLMRRYVGQVSSGTHPLTLGHYTVISNNDDKDVIDGDPTKLQVYTSDRNKDLALLCSDFELDKFKESVSRWCITRNMGALGAIHLLQEVYKPNRCKFSKLGLDFVELFENITKSLRNNRIDYVQLALSGIKWPFILGEDYR